MLCDLRNTQLVDLGAALNAWNHREKTEELDVEQRFELDSGLSGGSCDTSKAQNVDPLWKPHVWNCSFSTTLSRGSLHSGASSVCSQSRIWTG